jgi:hypothetical protein
MKSLVKVLTLLSICLFLSFCYLKFSEFPNLLTPSAKKLDFAIREDLQLLKKTKTFPAKEWMNISQVEISSDASPVQDWISKDSLVITKKPDGDFKLNVFATLWLDENRYGAIIQYDLVDLKTKNTVWELNRTYKLGWIY